MAAGVFQFIADNLTEKFDVPTPADVSPVSLNFLIKWSLAAAQECFVLKGISEKTIKDGMIAKLSLATGQMYENARELGEGLGIGSIYGKNLDAFLLGKATFYKSLAQFRKSTESSAASRFGEEISRLTEANQILNRVKETKKLLDTETVNQIETLSGQIARNLERAVKDNSIIYHEVVPAVTGLAEIGQAVVARATVMPDWSKEPSVPSRPILARLVPETIRSRSVEYYQKRNEQIEEIYSRIKGLKQAESDIMRECNLPSLLDVSQQNMGLPLSIIEKSQQVRSCGGSESLYSSMTTIESLKGDAKQLLKQVEELLSEENLNDLRARQEFGSKWTRPESETLAKNLHQALNSYKKSMIAAAESDTKLQKEFDEAIVGITALDSSQAELEESIPASTSHNSQRGDTVTAGKLRQKLAITANFDLERNLFTERIQNYATNDQVEGHFTSIGEEALREDSDAQLIISDRLNNSEMLQFAQEIDKIECEQQAELAELRNLAIGFAASLTLSSTLEERQNALQTLETAYTSYTSLTSHFQEALTFYSGLLDLLQKLRENTRDFTVSRGIEMEEIRGSLQRAEIVKAAQNSSSSNYGSSEMFNHLVQQPQQVHYVPSQPMPVNAYMMPLMQANPSISLMHGMPPQNQVSPMPQIQQQWHPGMPVQYAPTAAPGAPVYYQQPQQPQQQQQVQGNQYPGNFSQSSTTNSQSQYYFNNPYSQQ